VKEGTPKTQRRWEHNIESDGEAVRRNVDWVDVNQGRNTY